MKRIASLLATIAFVFTTGACWVSGGPVVATPRHEHRYYDHDHHY